MLPLMQRTFHWIGKQGRSTQGIYQLITTISNTALRRPQSTKYVQSKKKEKAKVESFVNYNNLLIASGPFGQIEVLTYL